MNRLSEDLDHILHYVGDNWNELKDESIFITGGTGFFGCWLLESLVWANKKLGLNAKAVVLTRNYKAFHKKAPHLSKDSSINFVEGDMRNFEFPESKFSYIIHAATDLNTNPKDRNQISIADTIIEGTRRVLEFAVCCGAKKILFTSSGAVYGKQPDTILKISEDYLDFPNDKEDLSAYGIGKLVSEELCSQYSEKYGFKVKIARCYAFIGPYLPLDAQYAIGNFIQDGLNNTPVLIKGDGKPYRSYLYSADLMIWLWTVLINGKSCYPYNVGSEIYHSIEHWARLVSSIFGETSKVKFLKKNKRVKSLERYVPSTKRATSELGLKQSIGIDVALAKTIRFHTLNV